MQIAENLYDVEAYLIENGTMVTPKKLQKLLYFSQGWFMALNDSEIEAKINAVLFREDFQAWKHGPVIPSTYGVYKHNYYTPIREVMRGNAANLKDEVKLFLQEVLEIYNKFSGDKLEAISHEQSPWKNAYNGELNQCISKESIYEFFLAESLF